MLSLILPFTEIIGDLILFLIHLINYILNIMLNFNNQTGNLKLVKDLKILDTNNNNFNSG